MLSFFNKHYLIIGLFYLIILFISIFLISHQLSGVDYPSDTIAHLEFVNKYFNGEIYIPHPLWHMCVHYITYITLDGKMAATLVTTFFIIFWIFIIHALLYSFFYETKKDKVNTSFIVLVLAILFVIGPFHLPFFNTNIYLGIGSPNVWHNVTLFTVKPFALLTVFFTILIFYKNNLKYFILSILFLIISMFAKPSFAIAFIPTLVIYFILKKEYSKKITIFLGVMLTTFILILFFQYFNTYEVDNDLAAFGKEKAKIIIDFLGPWSLYTPNVFISILLATAFPFLFLILNYKLLVKHKSINSDLLYFSWIMTIISIVIFAIFAEEGSRYHHLNFGWSYEISLSILYVFTLISYVNILDQIGKYKKWILNTVLLYQVSIGLFYLYKILSGQTYA